MKLYESNSNSLKNVSKKEKKIIETSFPFIPTSLDFNKVDLCAERIVKTDLGFTTKFCPLCDFPMIVRILYTNCDHVVCFSCSKPDSDACYVCNTKCTKESIKKIPDKAKFYECDYPDCLKFYETFEKLFIHKQAIHGVIELSNY